MPDILADARQTALLLPIREAEGAVGPWRALDERGSRLGVPAHVTLIVPFVEPSAIDEDLILQVGSVLPRSPVPIRLTEFGEYPGSGYDGTNVLWLRPEPAEPIVDLIRRLQERFGLAPYGGIYDGIEPHLTVIHWTDPDLRDRAVATITPHLPIEASVDRASLMGETPDGMWSQMLLFPFEPDDLA